jgi:hypothetical protein
MVVMVAGSAAAAGPGQFRRRPPVWFGMSALGPFRLIRPIAHVGPEYTDA